MNTMVHYGRAAKVFAKHSLFNFKHKMHLQQHQTGGCVLQVCGLKKQNKKNKCSDFSTINDLTSFVV